MAEADKGARPFSLVKFDKPEVLIGRNDRRPHHTQYSDYRSHATCNADDVLDDHLVELCKSGNVSHIETEQILGSIAPPREWEEDGKRYRQHISKLPATRGDIMDLSDGLNDQLTNRQARPDGICPIRRELADQSFDELIRQITISQPERGLLLLRVRDELRMTLLAYQDLFVSSRDYDPYKAVLKESFAHQIELEAKLENLNVKFKELQVERDAMYKILDTEEQIFREARESAAKKHHEEFQFLKRVNNVLKQHTDSLLDPANNIDPVIDIFDPNPKKGNRVRKGRRDPCKLKDKPAAS